MQTTASSSGRPAICTILLVEDDDAVREVTRRVLEKAGYFVLEAAGSRQALAVVGRFEGPIHLLLTDIVMPSMNGGDLALRLRESNPELTTLFMSGYTDHTLLSKSTDGSPVPYIQKPFTVDLLLSRVAEAMSVPCKPGRSIIDGHISI